MSIVLKNNASDFLAAAIDSSQTTLTLQSAASFPSLSAGEYFYGTLENTAGQVEIVKVTARVGNTLTVVRAQEGTSAASFVLGSRFELRTSVGSIEDYVEQNAELGLYTPPTASTIRNIQSKLTESVSVKDFGAVGDGVTDDTAAIQAAINYGEENSRRVFIPAGTYIVSSNLVVPFTSRGRVFIEGEGYNTTIVAQSTVTRVFDLESGISFATFKNFSITGDGIDNTTYGIYAPSVLHTYFANLFIRACNTGMYLQFGWCNYIEDCTIWYCYTGAEVGDAWNQCTFMHCKFWLNYIGLVHGPGFASGCYNCLFERNAKIGVVVLSSAPMFSNCYFESNARVEPGQYPAGTTPGWDFTDPATTVYCDVFIDGGAQWRSGTMRIFAPTRSASFLNCFTQMGQSEANGGTFIYMTGARDITVKGCHCKSDDPVPVVKVYADNARVNANSTRLENNSGFSKNLLIEDLSGGPYVAVFDFVDTNVSQFNYAETDLSRWSFATTANGATWQRTNISAPNTNSDVWELVLASTADTGIIGFTINAADYPQNIGKLFVVDINYKVESAGTVVTPYIPGNTFGSTITGTNWVNRPRWFIWPDSGTLLFGFKKEGNAGSLYVAEPVIVECGGSSIEARRDITKTKEFYGEAAPTAGDWLRGDRVWDLTPSAAGVAGWICVASGSPGTWKEFGTIEA